MNIFWIYPPPFNSGTWRFSSGSATKHVMSSWWWLLLAGGASQIILFRTFKGTDHRLKKVTSRIARIVYNDYLRLVLISLQLFILLWHIQSLPDFASNQSIPKSFPSGPTWPGTSNFHDFRYSHGLTWDPQPQIMRSADMERGFPMPKGCYYKGYPTGNRREVWVWRVGGWKLSKLLLGKTLESFIP